MGILRPYNLQYADLWNCVDNFTNLIDYMTPAENVALTSKLPPLPVLERLGLTKEEAKRNVLRLSGGQPQRAAIARALASDARVILADEPTGNLDEDTAVSITNILKECAHQMNKCVIIATHSNELAKRADVILKLRKGELQIRMSEPDGGFYQWQGRTAVRGTIDKS